MYTTYLVDGIIEGSIKFALLNQRDVYSPDSADYGQLFIEPDADVFETVYHPVDRNHVQFANEVSDQKMDLE